MKFIIQNFIFNMVLGLVYCYLSPTTQAFFSQTTKTFEKILLTFIEVPKYWIHGSKNVFFELGKIYDLTTARPDLLLLSPLFWSGSIVFVLGFHFILTAFITETKTKQSMISIILVCANIATLEAYFNVVPTLASLQSAGGGH